MGDFPVRAGCLFLVTFLEVLDGLQYLISGLGEGDALATSGEVGLAGQAGAVDLRHQEPGQGGEDKIEKVLADVDHNVVVSEDAIENSLSVKGPEVAKISKSGKIREN